MIQELQNFRQKYPQYEDMDDVTLANRLASKYPDAYGDILEKVQSNTAVIEKPQKVKSNNNPIKDTMLAGFPGRGLSRGQEAVEKGITFGDVPHLAAKTMSGALAGVPEFLMKRPIAGPIEGFNTNNSIFPEAKTQEGGRLGNELGVYAGFIPAIEALQGVVVPGAKAGARSASNRLMNSVLKPSARDLSKNPQLGYEAAKKGLTGTRGQIFKKAEKLVNDTEVKLQGILDKSDKTVDATKIADVLEDTKRPFLNTGDDTAVEAIEQIQNTLRSKGTIPVKQANQLKRDFYATLRDSNYGTADVGAKITGKKDAARGIKESIEKSLPDDPIKELNQILSLGGKTGKLAEKSMAMAQRNNILGLVDMGLLGGGVGTGNPLFYAAALGRKAVGSPLVRSKLAELLAKVA